MAHGVTRLAVEDSAVVGFFVGEAVVFVGEAVDFVGEAVGLAVVGFFVGEGVGLFVGGVGEFVGAFVSNESSQPHWHTDAQGNSPPAKTLVKPDVEKN
jgi:hypothetical protein